MASQMTQLVLGTAGIQACKQCNTRQQFFDGNKLHPFCSRTCAKAAKEAKAKAQQVQVMSQFDILKDLAFNLAVAPNQSQYHPQGHQSQSSRPLIRGPNTNTIGNKCLSRGCNNTAVMYQNGISSPFCAVHNGKTNQLGRKPSALQNQANQHQSNVQTSLSPPLPLAQVFQAMRIAQALCLWCKIKPQFETQQDRSLFCGRKCITLVETNAPLILSIPSDHPLYQNVSNQFTNSWRHPSTKPQVKYIYKIVCAPYYTKRYKAYRQQVEVKIQYSYTMGGPGNEQRRWHGTKRACTVGDNGNTVLCSSVGCALCSIIKTSFDLRYYQNNTSWGRFGRGHYVSSTSSKASDYSINGSKSPTKALLLNKVVVGKGEKLTADSPNLTAPPTAGYDSVLGETGGSLRYDECVVYNDSALLPTYLVIYG